MPKGLVLWEMHERGKTNLGLDLGACGFAGFLSVRFCSGPAAGEGHEGGIGESGAAVGGGVAAVGGADFGAGGGVLKSAVSAATEPGSRF